MSTYPSQTPCRACSQLDYHSPNCMYAIRVTNRIKSHISGGVLSYPPNARVTVVVEERGEYTPPHRPHVWEERGGEVRCKVCANLLVDNRANYTHPCGGPPPPPPLPTPIDTTLDFGGTIPGGPIPKATRTFLVGEGEAAGFTPDQAHYLVSMATFIAQQYGQPSQSGLATPCSECGNPAYRFHTLSCSKRTSKVVS